jgi:hypothetical protein
MPAWRRPATGHRDGATGAATATAHPALRQSACRGRPTGPLALRRALRPDPAGAVGCRSRPSRRRRSAPAATPAAWLRGGPCPDRLQPPSTGGRWRCQRHSGRTGRAPRPAPRIGPQAISAAWLGKRLCPNGPQTPPTRRQGAAVSRAPDRQGARHGRRRGSAPGDTAAWLGGRSALPRPAAAAVNQRAGAPASGAPSLTGMRRGPSKHTTWL